MENPRNWINVDESAQNFLTRVLTECPSLLLPPLHRVPLRVGNVVEIAGPSPSAKSEILLQAAVNCVLPKTFGGLERMVAYFDLDCRFDVVRFANALKLRVMEVCAPTHKRYGGPYEVLKKFDPMAAQTISTFDNELFLACMRRFLYIRCYNSIEFLAALKTMHYQFQKESETLGISIHFLMIDSIGAFHWIDRAGQPLHICDSKRAHGKCSEDMADLRTSREKEKLLYREYMPSIWQSFVTHRIHLGVSDGFMEDMDHGRFPIYTSEWVQPQLNILDKFTVKENGIFLMS